MYGPDNKLKRNPLPNPDKIPSAAYLVVGVHPKEKKIYFDLSSSIYILSEGDVSERNDAMRLERYIQADFNNEEKMNKIGNVYENKFDVVIFDKEADTFMGFNNIFSETKMLPNVIKNLLKVVKRGGVLIMNHDFFPLIPEKYTNYQYNKLKYDASPELIAHEYLKEITSNKYPIGRILYSGIKEKFPIAKNVYDEREENDRVFLIRKTELNGGKRKLTRKRKATKKRRQTRRK
jgi:hypothetical protein